jgi:ketosteroid isomerase-like protein
MNRRCIVFPSMLVLTVLIGCGQDDNSMGPADEVLMKADMEFAQTISIKGLPEALKQYLSDDAVQLLNNAPPLRGKEAIMENLVNMQPQTITRNPLKAEVAASGDLGYTWGSEHILLSFPNGTTAAQYTKYLTVWKKDSGGVWKILIEMTNTSPPSREG